MVRGRSAARLEGGDRGHIDNVIRHRPAREIATRPREALDDGADGRRPGEALHELVGDVSRVERGEDEDVGLAGHRASWRLPLPHGTDERGIPLQFSVHRELGRKVALVDGNLQFGDHRVFLDLGLDRKSIVDIVSAPSIDQDLVKQVMVKHDSGVDLLLADPTKARTELRWEPQVDFRGLVRLMVEEDYRVLRDQGRGANQAWAA